MASISLVRGEGEPGTDRAKEVARAKRELALALFLRQGAFWQAVKQARMRCGIEGRVGVPGPLHIQAVFAMDRLDWSPLGEKVRQNLLREVPKLKAQVVPESLQDDILEREWGDFLTGCIIYDPPADKLLDFARCGGPTFVSSGREKMKGSHRRIQGAPPIRVARDPGQKEIKRVVHIVSLLEEIDQAHPEIAVWDLVEDRGVLERFSSDIEKIPRRFYIDVREDTTADDVADAYRLIRQFQKGRRGGAPPRDPLIAVQCAVIYDRYNRTDPTDKRRREWTHEKLAKRFGLKSGRAAKEHIALGRTILAEKGVQ